MINLLLQNNINLQLSGNPESDRDNQYFKGLNIMKIKIIY